MLLRATSMPIQPAPPLDASRLPEIIRRGGGFDSLEELLPEGYPHWDELRHRKPPKGLSAEEWWAVIKFARWGTERKPFPLLDSKGRPFTYTLPDPIPELLHRIDQGAAGTIEMPDEIANPASRDRYLMSSLIEEALRSSQVEGASMTRDVAKAMIRSGRDPRNTSERMVLNNFRAMERIRTLKAQELTPTLVLDLHRVVTEGTLSDASQAGRIRLENEKIRVEDHYGEVLHIPPPASELTDRMRRMCEFANAKSPQEFLHPVLRAVLLHFWLAYDHPFFDGNGRCARALFYWSMLRSGYWLFEFISISEVIRKSLGQYQRAFLFTETDENDLTYFLLYHVDVIRKAREGLHRYMKKKAQDAARLESVIRETESLNHRQKALLGHAIRHPDAKYTVKSHRASHGVVYQTARTDLLDLVRRGYLRSMKEGRTYFFRAAPGLEERLAVK